MNDAIKKTSVWNTIGEYLSHPLSCSYMYFIANLIPKRISDMQKMTMLSLHREVNGPKWLSTRNLSNNNTDKTISSCKAFLNVLGYQSTRLVVNIYKEQNIHSFESLSVILKFLFSLIVQVAYV